ncbi:hypothetical protein J6590_012626 [Homalodisca vitripennis]|nr:hypothetical protein J6590_012626 [Homalodisca vitripennis]
MASRRPHFHPPRRDSLPPCRPPRHSRVTPSPDTPPPSLYMYLGNYDIAHLSLMTSVGITPQRRH